MFSYVKMIVSKFSVQGLMFAFWLPLLYNRPPQPVLEGQEKPSWHQLELKLSQSIVRYSVLFSEALQESNPHRRDDIWDRPAEQNRKADDPLEFQVEKLRRELLGIRASIARLAIPKTDFAKSSGGGDASRGGSITFDEDLHRLQVQEQQLRLEIAVALQHLNLQRPDGGRRLPEAEEHYRAIIAALESQAVRLRSPRAQPPPPTLTPGLGTRHSTGTVLPTPVDSSRTGYPPVPTRGLELELTVTRLGLVSNLAALLLEADRPHQALKELEGALAEAETLPLEVISGLRCSLSFNRGKALAAVGRITDAEEAYADTADQAVGVDPNCFAKACAAMTRLPDNLLPHVQSAVRLAEESGLRQRLGASVESGVAGGCATDNSSSSSSSSSSREGIPREEAVGNGEGQSGGHKGVNATVVGIDPSEDLADGGWLAGIGVSELGWLYFTIARALDSRDAEAGEVWRVLEQANSLLSLKQPYDPVRDWQQLRIITGVFREPLLRAAATAGVGLADETAIFVVGLPRSGSTLVETMLSRYPGVWGAGEDTALAPLTPAVNELLTKQGLSQPAALAYFGRRYLQEMRRRATASGWDPKQPLVRIVDKMLRNLWLIGYIEMLLPNACIVHIVRHPLDVALSCYSQPFGYSGVPWSWKLEHIGEQIRMAAALAAHWHEQLPPGRVFTLLYEELVAAPEMSARRLVSHCGLAWDPRVLQFHVSNRTVATASVSQVRKPLYNTSVGRWWKYEKHLAKLASTIQPEIQSYEADLARALRAVEVQNNQEQLLRQQQLDGSNGQDSNNSSPSNLDLGKPASPWDEL